MTGRCGCLKEFHPEEDSIQAYLEVATLYFTANDFEEDKQVPILLSSIKAQTYSLMCDLVAPKTPGRLSFAQIVEVLTSHFQPKCLVIAKRFHFHKRVQAVDESITEFDAALRKLAIHCEFGEMLEEILRDRDQFVCGLHHEAMQGCLLSEAVLTNQKALEIAKGMEPADSNTVSYKARGPVIYKLRE